LFEGYIFINKRKIKSLERGDMSKKFNRIAAKKNKKKSKSRFMDSIILSENTTGNNQTNSEINTEDSPTSASTSTSSVTVSQSSSFGFLSRELITIGIISGVLLVGLIVTSLIA
tara:strand:- start:382 stop:723 length:342 start_codon:yes stop_codon:yes gene_type:complete